MQPAPPPTANALPDGEPNIQLTPPGLTAVRLPPFAPPSETPTIWQMTCQEDPNMALRTDCDLYEPSGGTVVHGGFGHYFHPSGG